MGHDEQFAAVREAIVAADLIEKMPLGATFAFVVTTYADRRREIVLVPERGFDQGVSPHPRVVKQEVLLVSKPAVFDIRERKVEGG